MFNKYIINSDENTIAAAKINAEATEELGKKAEQIVDRMIVSKDRADISMQEYLKLREDVAKYERRLRDMGMLITALGIPAEVIDGIDRSTVRVQTCKDFRNYTTRYHIHFDVDDAFVRQLKEMKL